MKKTLQILIFLLISVSCIDSKRDATSVKRTLYIFDLDSLKRKENYKLTTEISDTLTKYEYQNLTDQNKNMKFFYIPKTKTLRFAFWDYSPIKGKDFKITSLSKTEFMNFEMNDPETDGTGPILFNHEYGVLGIGNVMAPNFVYLKDKADINILDDIIKKLTD
ncbi:hypothetical protein [Algibacter mikhailovii]|uniref:Lipoprotein n=1 Tax=Algibacter mikhailovii TaxID=425498 RepID=A0A918RCS5_9FLAO|nr:hypothetical protein [Algibacter mikhailovii]GGZ95144.1 hypothetical protein GCM10007028_36530 [Algibacter mikhailovii]